MRIDIDVRGLELSVGTIEGMRTRAGNLRPPLNKIARQLLLDQRRQFVTGRGWRRLAASTRRRKAAAGLDPRRLVAKGDLERALTSRSAVRITRTELRYGAGRDVYYARFHQTGRGVPRRRLVVARPEDKREWRERIGEYVVGDAR